jgi:hypothetical protein
MLTLGKGHNPVRYHETVSQNYYVVSQLQYVLERIL